MVELGRTLVFDDRMLAGFDEVLVRAEEEAGLWVLAEFEWLVVELIAFVEEDLALARFATVGTTETLLEDLLEKEVGYLVVEAAAVETAAAAQMFESSLVYQAVKVVVELLTTPLDV